jgi:sulfite exporter TauE/SafE/copper chaperone CopZ
MTCHHCEIRIEEALRALPGVFKAKADFRTASVQVTLDQQQVSPFAIRKALGELDYTVESMQPVQAGLSATRQGRPSSNRDPGRQTGRETARPTLDPASDTRQKWAVGLVILAAAAILSSLGWSEQFANVPLASQGMGYGLLFIIGLLTSLHCVAMCGGINLSQCLPRVASAEADGTSAAPAALPHALIHPTLLYNAGRVVAYTVIGGLVGALGSVINLPGYARGAVALVAGLFMIIMGLNSLALFPGLRALNPRLPKSLAWLVIRGRKRLNGQPFLVGLLNGLMPCGPLQAMQLYALSTGSWKAGALSMLAFSLGTVPLMLGLGLLSTWLTGQGRQHARTLMQASAWLVIVLGLGMVQNGLALSNLPVPGQTLLVGANRVEARQAASPGNEPGILLEDGYQVVTTTLAPNRYPPITVKAGIPVRWTIQADASNLNGCNNAIVIPALNLEVPLVPGDNVIEFTPEKSGTIPFSCWMGMIRSKITVID